MLAIIRLKLLSQHILIDWLSGSGCDWWLYRRTSSMLCWSCGDPRLVRSSSYSLCPWSSLFDPYRSPRLFSRFHSLCLRWEKRKWDNFWFTLKQALLSKDNGAKKRYPRIESQYPLREGLDSSFQILFCYCLSACFPFPCSPVLCFSWMPRIVFCTCLFILKTRVTINRKEMSS